MTIFRFKMAANCSNNLKKRIQSLEKIVEACMILMKDNIALQRELEARLTMIQKNYLECRQFDREEYCISKMVKFALTKSLQPYNLCVFVFVFSFIFVVREIFC